MDSNRLKLILLLSGFLIPVVSASWYFRTITDGSLLPTTNRGTLIQPVLELPALQLKDEDGGPAYLSFDEMTAGVAPDAYKPRPWQLLFMSRADCDAACVERLYFLRQMHIRLNRESERVQRVFVLVDDSRAQLSRELLDTFAAQQPDMRIVRGDPETLRAGLAPTVQGRDPVAEHFIYVADPVGNVMLYFTPENTLDEILKDIDKLLDQSSLG